MRKVRIKLDELIFVEFGAAGASLQPDILNERRSVVPEQFPEDRLLLAFLAQHTADGDLADAGVRRSTWCWNRLRVQPGRGRWPQDNLQSRRSVSCAVTMIHTGPGILPAFSRRGSPCQTAATTARQVFQAFTALLPVLARFVHYESEGLPRTADFA